MDDFSTLARDYGFRPQGKSAPMKAGFGSDTGDRRPRSSSTTSSPLFDDVFGGPPKYSSSNSKPSSTADFDYDSIFKSSATNEPKSKSSFSSGPVYDKPVYDEDIFDGLPGLKSKSMSSSARYDENVFASISSPPKKSDHFDDLLGNFGRTEKMEAKNNKSSRGFDDLLPGFGSGSPSHSNRPSSVSNQPKKPTGNSNQTASNVMDDPFVVLESTSTPGVASSGVFTDPLEDINKFSTSGNTKADVSSVSGGIFDDIDPLRSFGSTSKEPMVKSSFKYSESHAQKDPVDDLQDSHQTIFDMPTVSTDSHKAFGTAASSSSFVNANYNETNSQVDTTPRSEEQVQPPDDVWFTVEEIPLFTQPTRAPPPSRPPPPIPGHGLRSERGSFASNTRNKGNEFSQIPGTFRPAPKSPVVSQVDELEDFARGGTQNTANENADVHYGEEMNTASGAAASSAAMKEAMDRAEAKFRHAKEVREREFVKATRSKEAVQMEKDEEEETRKGDFRQNQDRLDRERRQLEEEEREHRRLEKEREKAREIEREMARQAMERAKEARERAVMEARERAAAEARRKAERAAVQRAQAEARERAAADARERAERAAAEARERANVEARERANAEAREKEAREKAAVARAEADARRRAERAAVERAAAEARERAAAEARERAAAAARMNQQKNGDDLESFFSMNSRPSSAPRPRASSSDPVSDPQFQSRGGPENASRTSGGASSNMKKASSTTNIVDDLSSIFGTAASSGEFQDIDGETEERRRARLERHQRTQERAAKALAEKNQRDLQTQREQEEKHRIAETLDVEIKRWAAGKEGNLRALLSTMQYVLWPECGWQPVSLTDLITGASVKKVYRKATLCIHPDKVQQKGANLQQKYIAEKVFDLLKEAWNKFNSEELF